MLIFVSYSDFILKKNNKTLVTASKLTSKALFWFSKSVSLSWLHRCNSPSLKQFKSMLANGRVYGKHDENVSVEKAARFIMSIFGG